jgi:ferric-dicitrate binding protein FerR (iron transport regulator)
MEHEDDTIARILEYLAGEQDEQAREETRRWIDADASRRELFDKTRRKELWLRWGVRVALVRGRYEQVRRRLARRGIVRWRRVAAVAALLAGVAAAIYPWSSPAPVLSLVEENLILPGKPRAVLYLASGESVTVSDSARTILDPDVAEINVAAGGELTYAPREDVPAYPGAMHRVIIPRGGEFAVELADGTRVWLNSRTELSYPVHFAPDRRDIYLKGEAYFEVASEERPLVVHAGEVDVRALGTGFNINTQTDGVVRAVLVTGSVEVSSGGERVTLVPGQMAAYREEDKRIVVATVNVMTHVAWKDDNFIFENECLEEIMTTLSLWYDVDVVYENEEVKTTRLTGDLERYEDIRKLLYFFEKTSDRVKFEIKGKTITIR